MPVLFVITTLQNLDIFKIDGVISVSKMSLKKKHPVYVRVQWYTRGVNDLIIISKAEKTAYTFF